MAKGKRGNGEGSIVKRNDGRWMASITVGYNENGTLKRKYFYGKTRSEVSSKLNEAINEQKSPLAILPSDETIETWLGFWLSEYAAPSIKQSTRSSYDTYIKKHLVPELGDIKLTDLTSKRIQIFYNRKLESGRLDGKGGVSSKTLRNLHNMLHAALDQAVKNELLQRNPCNATTLPKMSKKEIQILSNSEQNQLIASCKNERLGFAIILTLFTGLRLGELLGLQWSDIDFEHKTLTIQRTYNRLKSFNSTSSSKTELVIGIPKTKNSIRTIPLSLSLIEKLLEFKDSQEKEKSMANSAYQNQDFIFTNEIGSPIEPRTFQKQFKKILNNADIKDINFHALRHTFATRALELGVPIKTVSEILGHATVQITMDTYMHVSHEHMRDSMEKISELLNPFDQDK